MVALLLAATDMAALSTEQARGKCSWIIFLKVMFISRGETLMQSEF